MKTHYGGQALIEGVLIRGRSGVVATVRAPDGNLVTREEPLSAQRRGPLGRLPVVRGMLALGDTLAIGTRMLMFSADIAAGGTGESLGQLGSVQPPARPWLPPARSRWRLACWRARFAGAFAAPAARRGSQDYAPTWWKAGSARDLAWVSRAHIAH